ncbi:MAG: 6-pyruvoyl-tetrahydropterin synthase-related protein [Candidatus Roizmanbacteria bacterium]|nr:6-pyruvoyl-tetrahydropterin synthase-related protein [Candidatus Roizmanbacteria bacterium]
MKKFLLPLFSIVACIGAILPLLNNSYFSMHDQQHVVRLYLMNVGMHQGIWYPRLVDGLGFGFGYPLFNFYPPLFYFIAQVFVLIGMGYIWSIKLALISLFVISYVGMYGLVYALTKNRVAATLAGVLYVLAPYHAVLIFVRGAFAEFTGYAFIPLVLWGFVRIVQNRRTVLYGTAVAALLLSHPFVSFPFFLLFPLLFFATLFFEQERIRIILQTAYATLIGFAIAAFFWLPSMMERNETLVSRILTTQLADYKMHFLYLRQLLYSRWDYGGSIYGLEDGMSFQIGFVHIALVAITATFTVYTLWKTKSYKKVPMELSYGLLLGVAILMTTFKTQWIWDRISFLWYLQFPWRFLVFVSCFSSILAALWLTRVAQKWWYPALIVTLVVSASLYVPYFKPARFLSGDDRRYLTKDQIQWEVSRTSYEFMHKSVATVKEEQTTRFALLKTELPTSDMLVPEGVAVTQARNTFYVKEYEVNSDRPFIFTLNRSYFLGWTVAIDGVSATLTPKGKAQVLTVSVPAGTHTITYAFTRTPIRTIGWILTFVGLMGLFYLKKIDRFSADRLRIALKQS